MYTYVGYQLYIPHGNLALIAYNQYTQFSSAYKQSKQLPVIVHYVQFTKHFSKVNITDLGGTEALTSCYTTSVE